MPLSKQFLAAFQENFFYHVTCKAIDGKKLFLNDENRKYFLKRYLEFSADFFDTYAFCLLDNHIHLLIKTNAVQKILEKIIRKDTALQTSTHKRFLKQECTFHELIEQQFNRLFIAYSLSFNKVNKIKGHLLTDLLNGLK